MNNCKYIIIILLCSFCQAAESSTKSLIELWYSAGKESTESRMDPEGFSNLDTSVTDEFLASAKDIAADQAYNEKKTRELII